jgi:hypothetical protein
MAMQWVSANERMPGLRQSAAIDSTQRLIVKRLNDDGNVEFDLCELSEVKEDDLWLEGAGEPQTPKAKVAAKPSK